MGYVLLVPVESLFPVHGEEHSQESGEPGRVEHTLSLNNAGIGTSVLGDKSQDQEGRFLWLV